MNTSSTLSYFYNTWIHKPSWTEECSLLTSLPDSRISQPEDSFTHWSISRMNLLTLHPITQATMLHYHLSLFGNKHSPCLYLTFTSFSINVEDLMKLTQFSKTLDTCTMICCFFRWNLSARYKLQLPQLTPKSFTSKIRRNMYIRETNLSPKFPE